MMMRLKLLIGMFLGSVEVKATSPSPPIKPIYDVTKFETEFLSKWIEQYRLSSKYPAGSFSLTPNGSESHPYSTSDVAHVLCFANQLDSLTELEKDSWAEVINQFQGRDGFYQNISGGGTLWHAVGYVTSGLGLLERQPLHRNIMFDKIASTPSLWEPTIQALLNVDETPAPENITSGCNSGYPCAQNIASLASWYIQTNSSTGLLEEYRPFMEWYFPYLKSVADPVTGLWCSDAQKKKHGEINCIGGSFHVDSVFQYVVRNALYPAGSNGKKDLSATFPFPKAQLNSSLALQSESGAWSSDGLQYLDVDGIYQTTRPSVQLGKSRWSQVETACDKLMAITTNALTDESILFGHLSSSSHLLPGLVSAVAECQTHFPNMIKSIKPWKMCLDQVPYI